MPLKCGCAPKIGDRVVMLTNKQALTRNGRIEDSNNVPGWTFTIKCLYPNGIGNISRKTFSYNPECFTHIRCPKQLLDKPTDWD